MILYPTRDIPLKLKKNELEIFELPGVIQSISISGDLNSSSDNDSYVILGYNEKRININLTLIPVTETAYFNNMSLYKQLKKLEKLFNQQPTDQLEPSETVIFEMIHDHLQNRGIHYGIFESLTSSESVSKNTIDVSLTFIAIRTKDVQNARTNFTN